MSARALERAFKNTAVTDLKTEWMRVKQQWAAQK